TTWRRRFAGSSAELVGSSIAGAARCVGGSKNGNGPATAAVDQSAASATAVRAAVRAKAVMVSPHVCLLVVGTAEEVQRFRSFLPGEKPEAARKRIAERS